jgi:hypothetical protein
MTVMVNWHKKTKHKKKSNFFFKLQFAILEFIRKKDFYWRKKIIFLYFLNLTKKKFNN